MNTELATFGHLGTSGLGFILGWCSENLENTDTDMRQPLLSAPRNFNLQKKLVNKISKYFGGQPITEASDGEPKS